jgi:hypothetical protein
VFVAARINIMADWISWLSIALTGTSVDIVKSGGYKLSALEIEAALLQVLFYRSHLMVYMPSLSQTLYTDKRYISLRIS